MFFDWRTVPNDDTTFRVESNRVEDLKSKALAAYFAPSELLFYPAEKTDKLADGAPCRFYASADTVAVMNRLDMVCGQDGWTEDYETLPGGSVRCTITIRFSPDKEPVQRCGVGSGETEKAAHRDAFERAAVKFGIARYLYDLPPFRTQLDKANDRPKVNPPMPQGCLPTYYRECGRSSARELLGMLESALAEAKIPKERWREAAAKLIGRYGYKVEDKALDRMQNGHVRAMKEQVHEWQKAIAKNVPNPVSSPFYVEPPREAFGYEPVPVQAEQKPTIAAAPAGNSKPATGKLAPPATGAELLARVTTTDSELARVKRIDKGALMAHVLEYGVRRNWSSDMTIWNFPMVSEAYDVAKKWIEELPPAPEPEPQAKPTTPAPSGKAPAKK